MKPKEQAIDVNPDNSDNMKNVKVLCICRHDKKYKIPYRMQKKIQNDISNKVFIPRLQNPQRRIKT